MAAQHGSRTGALVTYYPLPDIPADAPPSVRRFCEQVRTVISNLDAHGQAIEVHQPFFTDPTYTLDEFTLLEFPVYRADVPMELLYATWTVPFSADVTHNLRIHWRPGDGAANRVLVQAILAASVTTKDWTKWVPKRFEIVTRGRRILPNQILTLEVEDTTEDLSFPFGLLSLYLRKAREN